MNAKMTAQHATNSGAINDLNGAVNAVADPLTVVEIAEQLQAEAQNSGDHTVANSLLQQAYEADRRGVGLGLHLPGLPASNSGPLCIDGDNLMKSLAVNSLKPQATPVRINHTLDALGEYTGIRDGATLTSRTMAFLEAIARTPAVQLIIRTRVAQAQRFCRRPRFKGDIGFGIRQIEERRQLSGAAARERDALEDYVLHGGYRFEPGGALRRRAFDGRPGVWDGNERVIAGGLQSLTGLMVRNALAFDWAPVRMEPGRDEAAMPISWFGNCDIDAKQIRRTYEEKYVPQIDRSGLPIAFVELEPGTSSAAGSMVSREFPWNRMAVMVRNPRTDYFGLGYGYSETEAALDILASLVLNLKFRAEYFDNNHIPPAIVALRGQLSGFNDNSLSALRTQIAMKGGGINAFFKLLYLGLPADEKAGLEIHPLRPAIGAVNEMEYAHSDFQALMSLLCALFLIDPAEVGFKGDGGAQNAMQEADPESRLEHSQDKGLVPLMEAIADFLNKNILQFLNPDFEFVWLGLYPNAGENDAHAQTLWAMGYTANEIKDQQDRPRDLHAKDTVLWAKISRKWAPDQFDTPEEWRDKVDGAYEKEFIKKYGEEIEAWSTAWDEPGGSPSLMQTIGAEKAELQGAKAQQAQIGDLVKQGYSLEQAKQLARQSAMGGGANEGQDDGQMLGDGGPLAQIPRGANGGQDDGQKDGQKDGQNAAFAASPLDADAPTDEPPAPLSPAPPAEETSPNQTPENADDEDDAPRFGAPRPKLNKSFARESGDFGPRERVARERIVRIVRI